jgi:hypothetical protein
VTLGATNSSGAGHATMALTVSAAVSHSVTLSWVASTSPNVAGYNVYRGTVSLSGPFSRHSCELRSDHIVELC